MPRNLFQTPTILRNLRRPLLALAPVLLLVFFHAGCASPLNMIMTLGYLIGGPPSIEPDFDAQTKKSLSEKDKVTLVLCYAPTELKWDFESVDQELGRHVTHRLNQNHCKVIDPNQVHAWLDENPDWDRPTEIGAYFKVDYVVFVELSKFSLYEENSSTLFRGRSDVTVTVYEMDGDDGDLIYQKTLASRFPIHAPVATADMSAPQFRRTYISRLSEEVGRLFYEYYQADDVGSGLLNGT